MKTHGGQGFAATDLWALQIDRDGLSGNARGDSVDGATVCVGAAGSGAGDDAAGAAGGEAERAGQAGRQSGARTEQSRVGGAEGGVGTDRGAENLRAPEVSAGESVPGQRASGRDSLMAMSHGGADEASAGEFRHAGAARGSAAALAARAWGREDLAGRAGPGGVGHHLRRTWTSCRSCWAGSIWMWCCRSSHRRRGQNGWHRRCSTRRIVSSS